MPGADYTSGSSARNGNDGIGVLNNNLIARLTQWSINHTMSETAWGDSDTEGYTARKRAREDATGTMTGKFDGERKIYALGPNTTAGASGGGLPGFNTKLVLWESKLDATGYWVFPCCLIQNFQITVDMDSKEVIEWTMDFGADGRFYRPGSTSLPTETVPT